MRQLPSRLISLSALALATSTACSDPVGDAPRATVKDAAPAAATPEAQKAPAAGDAEAATSYSFSQEGSKLGFVGAKITGKHDGGFGTFRGTMRTTGNQLESTSVDVDIDMASVFSDADKLTGHLKSPDFFDVEKFPKATFKSTKVEAGAEGKSTVTGNLTLRGVTKEISFPAKITLSEKTASAQAEFGINRKDFGIVYPGKPDDLIRDEVLLKFDIQAQR